MKMSRDEQVAAGIAMGIPRDKILSAIGITEPEPVRSGYSAVVGPRLDFPIRVVLPWSALVSDDAKYAPARDANMRAKIILKDGYRVAKAKARAAARVAMTVEGTTFEPLALPLSFVARVWVPDNHRRDVVNFGKCCLDAFEKVIYADDRWLYDTRWIRSGVDCDRPRAEIEVRAL